MSRDLCFEEAVALLDGLKYTAMGLSVSEEVPPEDQHIFGLIGDILATTLPVIKEEYFGPLES